MTRLNNPVSSNITGVSSDGTALLTIGSDPLPNDNAVTVVLLGVDISVNETCTVELKSRDVTLYKKDFEGASKDSVKGIERSGYPTHGLKVYVTGCSGNNVTRIVADVGFKFNGGAKAVGG